MTRGAISRRHLHRANLRKAHRPDGRGAVSSLVPHSASAAFNLHEEIDETLARWWRATRMGRRQLHR